MTARRTGPDTDARTEAATAREARGSVQEAIGKLIGDDAARERGTAEKEAAAADASDPDTDTDTGTGQSPRP